jgi:hypothetical protein
MSETSIRCPNCGTEIPVSEALTAQIRADLEGRLRAEGEARLKRAVEEAIALSRGELELELKDLAAQVAERDAQARAAEQAQIELRRKARELEEQNRTQAERIRTETEQALRREADERLKAAVAQAQVKAAGEAALEMADLRQRLEDEGRKLQEGQKAELALRQKARELEERSRELDLELARRLDAAKGELETSIRKTAVEEQALKLREKEKQIEDLRKALEDAKRRSELGSQELQGEVLELDIQAALERQFPHDRIEAVVKGARGADIVQRVRNERLEECGAIVWEAKNAKNWSPGWIDKLKQDQRALGAAAAVLVSVVLPDGAGEFERIGGVWIASRRAYPGLAVALREQLIQVAYARAASAGKHEKMELLYEYLSGNEFRQRVEAIVEAFSAMQEQLARERRAMEKQWSEREKQIQRVVTSTTRMYGALQGIVGSGLPAIPALELDGARLLEDGSASEA